MRAAQFVVTLLVGGALGYFGPAVWQGISRRLKVRQQEKVLREMLDIPVDQEVQPFKKVSRKPVPTDRPRLRSAVIKPTAHDRHRVDLED